VPGVDPTESQWAELSGLFKRKGHALFFDSAYLGFASGDVNRDAGALRQVPSNKILEFIHFRHEEPLSLMRSPPHTLTMTPALPHSTMPPPNNLSPSNSS
jgi:hypothetical protein